jgi:molybdenum cofactor biosynthesis enzyme MoaA
MENRVPKHLAGMRLSTVEYCRNLDHIARNGIRGISFTGGEPTLNPDLPLLVRHAARAFERVELTSNGFHLREMLPALAPHLHLLKVSLDATDEAANSAIIRGPSGEAAKACAAVVEACRLGLRVGVNAVLMRSTRAEIESVMAFCRDVNRRQYAGRAYVSVLDFYYSPEQRALWEREFVPIDELARQFEIRYGPRTTQERFGCSFYWFDANGVEVRFKDSLGATHRAPKCQKCHSYCQEGIYGLKHSVEGWVTCCPNGEVALGAHLASGVSDDQADVLLAPLIRDVRDAAPDGASFDTLVRTHSLKPSFRCDDRSPSDTSDIRLRVLR